MITIKNVLFKNKCMFIVMVRRRTKMNIHKIRYDIEIPNIRLSDDADFRTFYIILDVHVKVVTLFFQ